MICWHPTQVDADWVFGYGSLIWNPEFRYQRAAIAQLHGFHRAFCIRSRHYRGTPEQPGVVLGLDRGGSCTGMAFLLEAAHRADSLRRLFAREMPAADEPVYLPRIVRVRLRDGISVRALTFVADRDQPAYARLAENDMLHRLQTSHGQRGANREYAINTLDALEQHGIHDARLASIVARLRASGGE